MIEDHGNFDQRMQALRDLVGTGVLEARIMVDQVYARYQDGWGDVNDLDEWVGIITPTQTSHGPAGKPGPDFDHPRGGHAGYLTETMTQRGPEYVQEWADHLLDEHDTVRDVFIRQSNAIADTVFIEAPIEYWVLRNSASTKVTDNHDIVFERPALVPRLDQTELNAIRAAAGGDVLVSGNKTTGNELQHTSSHTSGNFSSSYVRRGRAASA